MTTRLALAGLLLAGLVVAFFLFMKGDGRALPETAASPAPAVVEDGEGPPAELVATDALKTEERVEEEIAETVPAGRREAKVEAGVFELTFLDESGAPLSDARWAVFDGSDVIVQGTTDENGRDRFETAEGVAKIGVAAPARPPHTEPIALRPGGEHTVRLPAGAVVAGWVLIHGAPPSETIQLRLWPEDDEALEELPRLVRRALNVSKTRISTKTAEDGTFRFAGLDPGWSGSLGWSDGYRLEPEEGEGSNARPFGGFSLELDAPREGIELRLEADAKVIGRVVTPEGEPIPNAHVNFRWSRQGSTTSSGRSAGRDGRFTFYVRGTLPGTAELTVADKDNAGSRLVELHMPRGSKTYDAGDVTILRTRVIEFVAQDGAGDPIAGAQARPVSEVLRRRSGDSTDSEGRGRLRVSEDERAFRVTAEGYR
ncbi:MAG: carboxypeptidase-like regulatory domain-containing protein, partial [Planctomycetota bacterium]|nr:carboxypeptidase-like regulatory domain-containing protein [Planctomycetota bacterium]